MITFTYVIKDEMGIHARPAGQLVKLASGLSSAVTLGKGNKKGDARKIFAVMGLGIKCGEEMTVTVEGEKEAEDAEKIREFLEQNL